MEVKKLYWADRFPHYMVVETMEGKYMAFNITPARILQERDLIPMSYYQVAGNNAEEAKDYMYRIYGLEKAEPKTEWTKGGIKIEGYYGTWHAIDECFYNGEKVYLLEHDRYGDETAGLIVNEKREIILEDVWNGLSELEYMDPESAYEDEEPVQEDRYKRPERDDGDAR